MTRLVYIGIIDGNADACKYSIERKCEEQLLIKTISYDDVYDAETMLGDDRSYIKLLVPFINKYSGWCAYVHSDFIAETDIDIYFNHAILNSKSPITHFVDKDVWVFNCADPLLKELNPVTIKKESYQKLLDQIGIATVDKV
jgi:hypothetical protein